MQNKARGEDTVSVQTNAESTALRDPGGGSHRSSKTVTPGILMHFLPISVFSPSNSLLSHKSQITYDKYWFKQVIPPLYYIINYYYY